MELNNRTASYTAAGVLPVKVLQANDAVINGRIRPYHIQLNPTNRCNLTCSWCSCGNRDVGEEMPYSEIRELLSAFAARGCKAATITGGGEPVLHPHINDIIAHATCMGIQCALVTNGYMLHRLETEALVWARISCSDTYDVDTKNLYFGAIEKAVARLPNIDWAFSYVLTSAPDVGKIKRVVEFAHDHGMTHVRLVSDLFDLDNVPDMDVMRAALQGTPGEELVIYQGRKEYTAGAPKCLISLLKPVIGADGNVYPCCGCQYALAEPTLDYEETMTMGPWRDFLKQLDAQQHFDGSACVKCYYGDYNELLELITLKTTHGRFL